MTPELLTLRDTAVRIVEGETILPPEKSNVLTASGLPHESLVALVETLRHRKALSDQIEAAGKSFDEAMQKQVDVVNEKAATAEGRKAAPFLGEDYWRELDTLYLAAGDVQKESLEAITLAGCQLGETASMEEGSDPYDWRQAKVL